MKRLDNKAVIIFDADDLDRFDPTFESTDLKIERRVSSDIPHKEEKIVVALLNKSESELREELNNLVSKGNQKYEEAKQAADDWSLIASEIIPIRNTLEYLNAPKVQHTNNQWVALESGSDAAWDLGSNYFHYRDEDAEIDEISNKVFRMWTGITTYANKYCAGWSFDVWTRDCHGNTRDCYGRRNFLKIAEQHDKYFNSKEDAKKYIEGRKKAYARYFSEICPPVPEKYKEYFAVHGVLLPDYTVAEQEKELGNGSEKAAGEKRKKRRDRDEGR